MCRRYAVIILPNAQKQLTDIPEQYRKKIGSAIDALAFDPRPHGCKKLVGNVMYRLRVGRYRIIYDINDRTITVTVTKAAHRSEAYRQKKK